MNKRTVLALLLSAVLSLGLLVSCGTSGATSEAEPVGLAVSEESFSLEDLEGLISGLGDVAVIQGSQRVELEKLLDWDDSVIQTVTLDTGMLNYDVPSSVIVTWTITVDGSALAQHLGREFTGRAGESATIAETSRVYVISQAEVAEFQSRHPEVPIYGSDNAPYDPVAAEAESQEPQGKVAQEQEIEEAPEEIEQPETAADDTGGQTAETQSGADGTNANTGTRPTGGNAETEPTEPEHQHVWHDFIAQRWVENIVTVPDYETQKTPVGTNFIFAYDGFTTSDIEEAKAHAVELIYAGVPDNYRTETIYETQTVQVGSHEEDQGWYEDYVAFQYCDCGAVQ